MPGGVACVRAQAAPAASTRTCHRTHAPGSAPRARLCRATYLRRPVLRQPRVRATDTAGRPQPASASTVQAAPARRPCGRQHALAAGEHASESAPNGRGGIPASFSPRNQLITPEPRALRQGSRGCACELPERRCPAWCQGLRVPKSSSLRAPWFRQHSQTRVASLGPVTSARENLVRLTTSDDAPCHAASCIRTRHPILGQVRPVHTGACLDLFGKLMFALAFSITLPAFQCGNPKI